MMKLKSTACAICEKDDSEELYPANFQPEIVDERIFSARRMPDKIHYRIVKCRKCGLVYSNPILPPEKIEFLYRKSTVTYDEHIENLNKTYSRYLKIANSFVPSKTRFLEIGCGNGFFLLTAKKMGYKEVWGVEPGEDSVRQADESVRKNIVIDIFKKGQFKKNYFDCIGIFQTLDHIVDPNAAIAEMFRILKKRGCVVVIVHDAESFSAKILEESSPIIDIEHTYLFSKKTLPKIFQKHGFKILKVFDVVNTHALGYWVYLSPLPSKIKKVILSILDKFHLGQIPVSLKAGNIGLIAQE